MQLMCVLQFYTLRDASIIFDNIQGEFAQRPYQYLLLIFNLR
jgi:hypothetical protein